MKNWIYIEVVKPWFKVAGLDVKEGLILIIFRELETNTLYTWGNGTKEINEEELNRWINNGWVKETNY